MTRPLLVADAVTRRFGGGRMLFGGRRPVVHAVADVTLSVRRGETLGVVGESGCGKSTLARMLVGLDRPSEGRILLGGDDLGELIGRSRSEVARRVQYVFQDPISSLNPRKTIRQSIEAPLKFLLRMPKAARRDRLDVIMDSVRLRPEFLDRYPHEFSGGQAQRIGIARAFAAEPDILVLDEPVSALDVSVQAQILNLLDDLKARYSLTYVFISHDLAVVEAISDRIAVMYFGRVAEEAAARDLFRSPRHPYTRLLFSAAPVPGRRSIVAEETAGELPDPLSPPAGCAFAPRCPRASEICRSDRPAFEIRDDRGVACHHPHIGS